MRRNSTLASAQRHHDSHLISSISAAEANRRQALIKEMSAWLPVLIRIGLTAPQMNRLALRALENRSLFQRELICSGLISEQVLFQALALDLGLDFFVDIEASDLPGDQQDFVAVLRGELWFLPATTVPYHDGLGSPRELIGLGDIDLAALREKLSTTPRLRRSLAVVPPKRLRAALIARVADELSSAACGTLAREAPDCSAQAVMTRAQTGVLCAFVIGVSISLVLWPSLTVLSLHLFFSIFFFACIALRMLAARHAAPPSLDKLPPVNASEMPVYSVLVPVYREAEVVPELISSLGKLVWPRSKLEIKIICESDDHETLAALQMEALQPWIEVIRVPPGGPRTKPKALTYALPLTRGEIVAIYDAEDKPHPLQLVEAWQVFQAAPIDLACLQAPLVITNADEGLLPRLFGFEYAALFRGILPWLSRQGIILPLGGTSNHFRRDALIAVGAWDPYNVTEDADLGLRLRRFGYRSATLTHPTFEEAPDQFRDWLPQRTRWFKGWLQTWLVHMRNPIRLWKEVGTKSFLAVQVLFAGMIVSALVHPVMWVTLIWVGLQLAGTAVSGQSSLILIVDLVNIICGYAAFLILGAATLVRRESKHLARTVMFTPFYWMMISYAAWRAVWQLYARPFDWEKTPHRRSGHQWGSVEPRATLTSQSDVPIKSSSVIS